VVPDEASQRDYQTSREPLPVTGEKLLGFIDVINVNIDVALIKPLELGFLVVVRKLESAPHC
jgi:hypothetical protein